MSRTRMDDSNNMTPASAVFESPQPHRRLKALEIIAYKGERLPNWMTTTEPYLISLVAIELINLNLSENVLPPLGILPYLKIVEITGAETVSCVSDSFYGPNGTFPSLIKKLTFSYMQNLEVWEQAHRAGIGNHPMPKILSIVYGSSISEIDPLDEVLTYFIVGRLR
ncbi:hypothetical protein PR202_gb13585 [Eleusine coracana subsp. coracana]|uniref:R13L1/DRL21-like LRR repeat region domain-containing protein n=1 Tax=Eleusine coracana subsp. coracana TaxID=191504 RepID=A0AAV5EU33_ELECO|nr:hypothetical protein PR202_gb13585 [Eleusine coracana subsp. coracana]